MLTKYEVHCLPKNNFISYNLYEFYRDVHYIEKNGVEQYYTMGNTPKMLEKKIKLLNYFRRYMNDYLVKAGENISSKDTDQLSRTPYLCQWFKSATSVIMLLTNGTLQVYSFKNY